MGQEGVFGGGDSCGNDLWKLCRSESRPHGVVLQPPASLLLGHGSILCFASCISELEDLGYFSCVFWVGAEVLSKN